MSNNGALGIWTGVTPEEYLWKFGNILYEFTLSGQTTSQEVPLDQLRVWSSELYTVPQYVRVRNGFMDRGIDLLLLREVTGIRQAIILNPDRVITVTILEKD